MFKYHLSNRSLAAQLSDVVEENLELKVEQEKNKLHRMPKAKMIEAYEEHIKYLNEELTSAEHCIERKRDMIERQSECLTERREEVWKLKVKLRDVLEERIPAYLVYIPWIILAILILVSTVVFTQRCTLGV